MSIHPLYLNHPTHHPATSNYPGSLNNPQMNQKIADQLHKNANFGQANEATSSG
jgi:hypothetical protein